MRIMKIGITQTVNGLPEQEESWRSWRLLRGNLDSSDVLPNLFSLDDLPKLRYRLFQPTSQSEKFDSPLTIQRRKSIAGVHRCVAGFGHRIATLKLLFHQQVFIGQLS